MKWNIVCCVRIRGEKIVSCVLDRKFDTKEDAEQFGDDYYAEIKSIVSEWEIANAEDITVLLFEVPVMELS